MVAMLDLYNIDRKRCNSLRFALLLLRSIFLHIRILFLWPYRIITFCFTFIYNIKNVAIKRTYFVLRLEDLTVI